jgi:hypothetical protein
MRNIQTEDGIQLENIPDGTTEADIKARLFSIREERGLKQREVPPESAPETQEQVVARETNDRMGRLNQAIGEATATLSDQAAAPEARQDAQDSLVGFNLEKNQLMSDPKWQQNAKEMEKKSLLDLGDAHQNLQTKAQEFGSGVVLDPVLNAARFGAEAIDSVAGTDLGGTVEKGQEWNDRMVAEARIDAGLDPKEWSGMRTTGNIAAELFLANKLIPKFGTGPTSVGSIFDRAKKLVTGVTGTGATAGGLSGGLQYRPEAGEDYSFLDLGEDTIKTAGLGAAGGKAVDLAVKGAMGTARAAANIPKYVDNLMDGGTKDAGKMARKALGPNADDAASKLEAHADKVPGAKSTPAEVLSDGDEVVLSALEKSHVKLRNPQANYTAEKATSAANRKAVEEIEGKGVQAARELRSAKSNPHYEAAAKDSKTLVKVGAPRKVIKRIIGQNRKNDKIKGPLEEIDALLVSSKNRLGRETSLTVQNMKSAVDFIKTKIKARNADGSSTFNTASLTEVKNSLEKQIALVSKDYAKAIAVFKEYSIPYNQAVVGEKFRQAFEKATVAGQSGEKAFLAKVNDLQQKINPKTNKPYLDALNPAQKQKVADVMLNLKRKLEVAAQAKAGAHKVKEVIDPPKVPTSGMFSPTWQVIKGVLNRAMGKTTEKGLQDLSEVMIGGKAKEFAKMIRDAKPVELKAMYSFFEDTLGREVAMAGGVVAGESGASSSKKDRANERLKKLIKKDK